MTFFKRYKNVKKGPEPIPDVFFFFFNISKEKKRHVWNGKKTRHVSQLLLCNLFLSDVENDVFHAKCERSIIRIS